MQNQFLSQLKDNRTELQHSINAFQDGLLKRINENFTAQKDQLTFAKQPNVVSKTTDENYRSFAIPLKKLHVLQEDNNKKLEQMRMTVDEKLHQA